MLRYKIYYYHIISSIFFSIGLLLSTGCNEQRINLQPITVNIKKDDGSAVLGFSIGWKEGRPTGGDFWETSKKTSTHGYTINNGPPYPFEKKVGSTCALDIDTLQNEITIFAETDDKYYGKTVLTNLSLNKKIITTINCSNNENKLSKNEVRPNISIKEIEKGILINLRDIHLQEYITASLFNGRITEVNQILDFPVIEEGVNRSNSEIYIDTTRFPEGIYTILIMVHPRDADGLYSPKTYIEYYMLKR